MADFKLTTAGYIPVTVVPDDFITHYMPTANGEYVKIYLYMLHCAKNDKVPSISTLADIFQCTENDIKRALKYWETKGLLVLTEEPSISEKEAAPVQEKHTYSAAETKAFKENNEVKQLLFVCEQYMSKQLTRTDIETLLYFYDQLHFSTDLIEYLVEYSVSKNKKSLRYMETVALEWHKKGIKTIEEAKLDSKPYSQECYQVLKALGINNHDPLPLEVDFVDRWMKEYGFTIDIILEACNRTILRTHKPDFKYTDRILESWHKKGIHTPADIAKQDEKYKTQKTNTSSKPATTNKFNQFSQRNYSKEQYSSMEKRLIEQSRMSQ